MDRSYDLVLLLVLVTSVCCGPTTEVVDTAPIVQGWKGKDIRLPCHFQGDPAVVAWVKESVSDQQQRTLKADFKDGNFRSSEERFDIDKDFSLVIIDLKVADEGLYFCQVVLNNFEDFDNSILLTVGSMASKHGIEECIEKSQSHQGKCTYQTPSNSPYFNLTCVVSGFKPKMSLLWTEESGRRLNSTVSRQTALHDDTYERFETITVSAKHDTEQTFVCTATGDSLNGTSTEEITILPVSEKRGNLGLIIGLIIGASITVCTLFLLIGKFLQKYHPDSLQRKGCAWNPCCRRPHEPKRVDEEEPFMLKSAPSPSNPTSPPSPPSPPSPQSPPSKMSPMSPPNPQSTPSQPSPPSLTKEQVQQCKEELKKYYRESRRTVTVDPLNFMDRVNLDDIYTNLSLMGRGNMRKTQITYEDILADDENGKLSKHLLIQGEGGVGKTTLSAKIAWDWCQGRILKDLDWVIVIPLRDVTADQSIGSIVKSYLSDCNAATRDEIDCYISKNPTKIILLFDGFDEFSAEMKERSNSEVVRILALEQYKSCKVIVTTRPWRSHSFKMNKKLTETYTFINVEGFNKENLTSYITRYFMIRQKNALADSLISFMEENDIIRSNMAPFPIYCAMLCLMWEDFSEVRRKEMTKLQTFSEIFGEMISFLKEHYASKVCEHLKDQEFVGHLTEAGRAIEDISQIALDGLIDRTFSFPEDHYKECHDAMETCCRVGVLTIEKNITRGRRLHDVTSPYLVESVVSFPHKLFQEYVAGVYVANVYVNDRAKYDELIHTLISQHEEFRYPLYFASAFEDKLSLDIIDGVLEYDDMGFCVDVAFECHTDEAARAVGERWEEYELSHDMSEHTKSGVVFMVQCDQARSLYIEEVDCGRTASRTLAEGMCSSSVLRKVTITDSEFHTDFYNIIGDKSSTCQIQDLSLRVDNWDDNSQHQSAIGSYLAKWVFTMPSLSIFSLECPYMDGDFLSTAAASASSCQIKDMKVSLGYWGRGSQNQSSIGGDLAQWLFTLPSLSSFSLDCPHLDGDFLSTAIDSVSSCQIQNLELSFGRSDDSPQDLSSIWGNLNQWVFTMPSLSSFSLSCPYLDGDFFLRAVATASSCEILPDEKFGFFQWKFILSGFSSFKVKSTWLDGNVLKKAAASASSCKIQDMKVSLEHWDDDYGYESSIGGDLAQWVFSLPSLSSFSLTCPYLVGDFLSKAIASVSPCQIQDMNFSLKSWYDDSEQPSSRGGDFAQWVFTLPSLLRFSLTCPYLDGDFLSTAISSASSCQIQDLKLCLDKWYGSPHHQSSIGGDLAQWVFTLPTLSNFSLDCLYLDGDFLSPAIASAPSCQIRHLTLIIHIWRATGRHASSQKGLAQWVCTLPHLSTFSMECYFPLNDEFFSTAATLAQSCQIHELSMTVRNGWMPPSAAAAAAATDFAKLLCRMPHLERANILCPNLPKAFFTGMTSQQAICKLEDITINGKPLNQWLGDK